MKKIAAREFMQRSPVAARQDMPLTELVATLRAGGFRAVPVVDEAGRVIGAVSESDLFLREHPVPFSTEKVPSLLGQIIDKDDVDQVDRCRQMTVGQVMTKAIATATEETPLEELAILMHERRLSMIPIVRDGVLTGVVRRSDILAIIYRTEA